MLGRLVGRYYRDFEGKAIVAGMVGAALGAGVGIRDTARSSDSAIHAATQATVAVPVCALGGGVAMAFGYAVAPLAVPPMAAGVAAYAAHAHLNDAPFQWDK